MRRLFKSNVRLAHPALSDRFLIRLVSFRLTSPVVRFNSGSRRRCGRDRSDARPALFSCPTRRATSQGFPEAHERRHKRRRPCWSKEQEETQVIAHDRSRACRGGCRTGNVVRSSSHQGARIIAMHRNTAARADSQVDICKRESYFQREGRKRHAQVGGKREGSTVGRSRKR